MHLILRFIAAALLFAAFIGSALGANLVFMIGEDEYQTWETLPEFVKTELEPLGHHVTVIHADEADKNHFPGLIEALREADLLFISVRRRTPLKAELDAVRAHLDAGKPLVGIRTASHAFALRPKDPPPDADHAVWQDFDPAVLGGHYENHYKSGPPTTITMAEGAAAHPILKGVAIDGWTSVCSLYRVSPLEPTAKPLLMGSIPGEAAEPIAWTHRYGKKQALVFYTSLGGVEDFANPVYRKLLVNGITWALAEAKVGDASKGRSASQSITKVFPIPADLTQSLRPAHEDDPFASAKSEDAAEVLEGVRWPDGVGIVIDRKTNLLAVRAPPHFIARLEAPVAVWNEDSAKDSGPTICYDEATFAVSPRKSVGNMQECVYVLPKSFVTESLEDELKSRGVLFPEGSAATYDAATHTATVRNTALNMELIVLFLTSVWQHSKEIPPFQDKVLQDRAKLPRQIELGLVDQTLRDLAAGRVSAK